MLKIITNGEKYFVMLPSVVFSDTTALLMYFYASCISIIIDD